MKPEEAWQRVVARIKTDADSVRIKEKAIIDDYHAGQKDINIIAKKHDTTRKYVKRVIEWYVEVQE